MTTLRTVDHTRYGREGPLTLVAKQYQAVVRYCCGRDPLPDVERSAYTIGYKYDAKTGDYKERHRDARPSHVNLHVWRSWSNRTLRSHGWAGCASAYYRRIVVAEVSEGDFHEAGRHKPVVVAAIQPDVASDGDYLSFGPMSKLENTVMVGAHEYGHLLGKGERDSDLYAWQVLQEYHAGRFVVPESEGTG